MILLVNYRLQLRNANPIDYLDVPYLGVVLLTIALTLGSISNCINAIATRKTTRSLHRSEIPTRYSL